VLLSLISDILDISKIEANSLRLEKISFDLEYLIESLLKMIKTRVQDKNIDLVCEFLPGTPAFFVGDPTRIRQIVLNLPSYASKFTERGEIKVTVYAPGARVELGASQEIIISIKDTGIGIPADKQDLIFHLFTQADESTTRKFGGTGLGLSIARALAQKMGGDIQVRSEFGKGSEFIVNLRLETTSPVIEKDISLVNIEDLKGKRIVIVDDNESALKLMERYCKDTHMDVIFLSNRAQKLLTWIARQEVLPDIIILDIMMPN
jgi:signal transduction histidine kinase